MYRIIKVAYTKRKLNAYELASQKKYDFVCDADVKAGDMIESPVYSTPVEVVDVRYEKNIPQDPRGFGPIKSIIIDKINGKTYNNISKTNNKSKMNTTKNSMFSGIIGKYKSQFIPAKEEGVRMSLSGLLCVPVDDEYVGVDKDNNLISFPADLTLEIPVYSISKLNSAIQPGDIIKSGPRSYSKVVGKNEDGSLKTLSFSGYTHNKKAVQDFVMGQATTRVLINMFNFDNESGFNPIFFAMASGETLDVNSLMMLSMTPQGKNLFSNAGGGFNPAMLWMLDQNKGGGSNMMEGMMMMSMMGGQNPFGNMFGQQPTPAANPTTTTQAPVPTTPTVDEALDVILKNPDAIAKLKDALKAE